jgi:hypothetical protein
MCFKNFKKISDKKISGDHKNNIQLKLKIMRTSVFLYENHYLINDALKNIPDNLKFFDQNQKIRIHNFCPAFLPEICKE